MPRYGLMLCGLIFSAVHGLAQTHTPQRDIPATAHALFTRLTSEQTSFTERHEISSQLVDLLFLDHCTRRELDTADILPTWLVDEIRFTTTWSAINSSQAEPVIALWVRLIELGVSTLIPPLLNPLMNLLEVPTTASPAQRNWLWRFVYQLTLAEQPFNDDPPLDITPHQIQQLIRDFRGELLQMAYPSQDPKNAQVSLCLLAQAEITDISPQILDHMARQHLQEPEWEPVRLAILQIWLAQSFTAAPSLGEDVRRFLLASLNEGIFDHLVEQPDIDLWQLHSLWLQFFAIITPETHDPQWQHLQHLDARTLGRIKIAVGTPALQDLAQQLGVLFSHFLQNYKIQSQAEHDPLQPAAHHGSVMSKFACYRILTLLFTSGADSHFQAFCQAAGLQAPSQYETLLHSLSANDPSLNGTDRRIQAMLTSGAAKLLSKLGAHAAPTTSFASGLLSIARDHSVTPVSQAVTTHLNPPYFLDWPQGHNLLQLLCEDAKVLGIPVTVLPSLMPSHTTRLGQPMNL